MSEHKRTITAISWSPGNPDLFASASADNLLIIWNVAEQRTVARLDNTKGQQRICDWSHRAPGVLTFITVLCFPRCPHISQLVLELSWWGGICVPAWPAIHLGLWWSWPRGHRPQRGPLVPLRHLPLQVAPKEKRQAGIWTHGWKSVHFSARCVCFLSSWTIKTFSSFIYWHISLKSWIWLRYVVQAVKAKNMSCAQSPWRAPMKRTLSALWNGTFCQQIIY